MTRAERAPRANRERGAPLFDYAPELPTPNGKTVVASACLCGVRCRWHGRKSYKQKVIRELEASGTRVIAICPEMLGSLPCPRPPVRTIKGRVYETDAETRSEIGRERTAEFLAGAKAATLIAIGVGAKEAYLCRTSPSCAPSGTAGRQFRENNIAIIECW